ncbi:hypothetical protein F3Y22_tig00110247pilonHSYRG00023 [Hibiscus syriacus]|uniref:Uncharacterized protein n=1 Tax=Hibiscus syriacus TaxID=106335 RepID=A0A6A3BBM4_HIBSY|nr:hypothetical protein F3Y22_tig00110247pilonHSYRG00023 [Hibiscus syriacus]
MIRLRHLPHHRVPCAVPSSPMFSFFSGGGSACGGEAVKVSDVSKSSSPPFKIVNRALHVSKRYPNATEVNLGDTRNMHLLVMRAVSSLRCPQLKSLSLKRSNMAPVALNCPLINLLDISSCHELTDAVICSAVTSCPQLESLDMSNCSCVSDETLREIAHSCANLQVLSSSQLMDHFKWHHSFICSILLCI